MAEDSLFTIRNACSLEDLRWVMKIAEDEGWDPREKDAECYYSSGLTSNFFIGELNHERISCICVLKYSDVYHYIGKYFVLPKYRGRGYGIRTWRYALELGDNSNCVHVLDAVVSMESKYSKREFRTDFSSLQYETVASNITVALSDAVPPAGVSLRCGSSVDIGMIAQHIRSVLGACHECLLASWIALESSVCFVAINENSQLIGVIILVKDIKSNYSAIPFLCDNLLTAKALLKMSVDSIRPQSNVIFKIPHGNKPGIEMLKVFGSVLKGRDIRMCRRGSLGISLHSVYGISTLD